MTPAEAWTPIDGEGSRTTVTTNLPNSIQYLPDERDVKLPEFSSHIQFVTDWEAGRLECSAMPPFVAARGTFEAGREELAQKYKYDPRGEYAAKTRQDHKKRISKMTDWWLSNDGRRRLITASGLGKIAPTFSMDPPPTFSMDPLQMSHPPTRLAIRNVTKVHVPMTLNRHHGQDQMSLDVIASRRDIRSATMTTRAPKTQARVSRSAKSTLLPMSSQDVGEEGNSDTLDLSYDIAATLSNVGEGRPGVQEELFKYLDDTYTTLHTHNRKGYTTRLNRFLQRE